MMDVSGLRLSLDAGLPVHHGRALDEIAEQLGIPAASIEHAQLLKRSVDARKKANVHFIASYRLELSDETEQHLLARAAQHDPRLKGLHLKISEPYEPLIVPQCEMPSQGPVIVGAGPAGLFAAWYLAQCGLAPLLIEQGAPVEERVQDVQRFFQTGKLDPFSNIQFGEGGAGTFSDGKLTTNLKNRYTAHVLRWFVDAGAPESILWQAHPHMGSDNLTEIVATIRAEIIRLGGTVRFHTKLRDLTLDAGRLSSLELEDTQTGEVTELACTTLILACGHSARSTFELMYERGFAMEQKPFSMGVRIEHPQALINEAQWGSAADHPALEAAEYKLAIHLPSGRSVYSFCMCPGGEVVAAASEEGGIVTNGMSDHARAGTNANAALLVNVDPADLGSDAVLAGVDLQRAVERRAYQLARDHGGAPYQAPAQRLASFLCEQDPCVSELDGDEPNPTYERGVVAAPLDEALPAFVTKALREAIPLMGKKIRGFDDPAAILTAPETRSSSPVRICRDDSLQAYLRSAGAPSVSAGTGVYPCGEGPGFAGGIMSAAIDGIKVAEQVARDLQDQATFEAAIRALQDGKPVVFPTDTVFGLGLAVSAAATPQELYELKHRLEHKPIAWLVSGVEDLARYGKNVPAVASWLAQTYWPGALTIVVEASDEVPEAYRSAEGTIALRMPDHPRALALIEHVGPLATTSANLSGDAAPLALADVPDAIASQVVVIAGKTQDHQASAVVDCTQENPRVIRAGSLDLERAIMNYLGKEQS